MTRRVRLIVVGILISIGLLVGACFDIEGGSRNGCDINNNCGSTQIVSV